MTAIANVSDILLNTVASTSQETCYKTTPDTDPINITRLCLPEPSHKQEHPYTTIAFSLSPALFTGINDLALKNHCPCEAILQLAWLYILGFYANTNDITIEVNHHIDVSAQSAPHVFPVNLQWDKETRFQYLLECIKKQNNNINAKYSYPTPPKERSKFGCYQSPCFIDEQDSHREYDIALDLTKHFENTFTISYSNDLYYAEHMHTLTAHFCNVLDMIVNNPEAEAGHITVLSEYEIKKIQARNNTTVTYKENTLIALLNHPLINCEKIAVIDDQRQITYAELHQQSNQIAHYLLSQQIKPHAVVAIYVQSSIEQIIIVLATIKAGLCFLPIDKRNPQERLLTILEDSQAAVCITDKKTCHILQSTQCTPSLDLRHLIVHAKHCQTTPPILSTEVQKNHLAYIVYTSGTTGTPKGVANTHQGVSNTFLWMRNALDYTQNDSILYRTSFSFDIAITEYLFPLTLGATIIIAPLDIAHNIPLFVQTLNQHNVTSVNFVPSHLSAFLEHDASRQCHTLKRIILVGEKTPVQYVQEAQKKLSAVIYNLYGPSESSIYCAFYKYSGDCCARTVPIGKPMSNVGLWILNPYHQALPDCMTGELYISGIGLAEGYYRNKSLTDQAFFTKPLLSTTVQRLYKTGDRVRYCENDQLEFLERIDDQVKIRGHRVELGEIEYQCLRHPSVCQAVIKTLLTPQDTIVLVGYICLESHAPPMQNQTLESFLKRALPAYMVPHIWMYLDNLPTRINGKIDRSQLPNPFTLQHASCFPKETATSPLEDALLAIWRTIFTNSPVNIHSDFYQLGGDSISCIRIVSKLYELGIELTVHDILKHSKITQLAQFLQTTKKIISLPCKPSIPVSKPSVMIMERDSPHCQPLFTMMPQHNARLQQKNIMSIFPLTVVQKGILFHTLNKKETYIEQCVLTITGTINIKRCHTIFNQLCQRHDLLRASIVALKNHEPYHVILKTARIPFAYIDLQQYEKSAQTKKIKKIIRQEKMRAFDLTAPPLIRIKLIQLETKIYKLLITDHHIISDGWSRSILIHEFLQLYRGHKTINTLPNTISFAHIVEKMKPIHIEDSYRYWKNIFSQGCIPSKLSIDQHDFHDYASTGTLIKHKHLLNSNTLKQLKKLSAQCKTTLNTLLQSAWAILLYRYSHHCQFGTVFSLRSMLPHNRECFSNHMSSMVIQLDCSTVDTLAELFHALQTQLLNSQKHAHLPMCQIKKAANIASHVPLFNYMTVFENYPLFQGKDPQGDTLDVSHFETYDNTHYPLTLFFIPTPDQFFIECHYQQKHFNAKDIQYLIQHLVNIFEQMQAPEISIHDIVLYSTKEKNTLLYQNNDTARPYPTHLTAIDLFQQQANKTPNHIALRFEHESFTYHQLDHITTQLAQVFLKYQINHCDIVPIFQQRHYYYLFTILALHKIGVAYLPLDATISPKRFIAIIRQCTHDLVLIDRTGKVHFQNQYQHPHYLCIDDLLKEAAQMPNTPLSSRATPDCLAYTIFTSGSTGQPKGVLIEHKALVNCLLSMKDTLRLGLSDHWLAITAFTFDISIAEYYLPWISGGQVVLTTEAQRQSPREISDLFKTHMITIMQATPSFWEVLCRAGFHPNCEENTSQVKKSTQFICTGESFPTALAHRLMKTTATATIWNLYGPTEAAIWTSMYSLKKHSHHKITIPIGQPIANVQVCILDKSLKPTATNIVGELFIGGAGLAKAYYHQPQLTSQAFMTNPFDPTGKTRLYRTGDFARWLPSGELEYYGRCDDQVKIRGMRVELREIDHALMHMPIVEQSTTRLFKSEPDDSLISFVQLKEPPATKDLIYNPEFEIKRLAQWKTLYEKIYADHSDKQKTTFNRAGWISYFSRKPIEKQALQIWRDNILERIIGQSPNHILEIGCGMGILLFPLLTDCKTYVGIDPSKQAIDYVSEKIKHLSENSLKQIDLQCCYAHNIQYPAKLIDTVLLNSVVQYFPSEEYLLGVLKNIIRHSPSATIVIGDVRSYANAELFYISALTCRDPALDHNISLLTLLEDFNHRENELLIHPHYFYMLKHKIPEITQVTIELKQAPNDNELSTFRYDVTLYVNKKSHSISPCSWESFDPGKGSLSSIEARLQHSQGEPLIAIEHIPNKRFNRYIEAVLSTFTPEQLKGTALATLPNTFEEIAHTAIFPHELYSLAKQYDYHMYCTWNNHDPLCLDVVFYTDHFTTADIGELYSATQVLSASSSIALTNTPGKQYHLDAIKQTLIFQLQENLPPYMLPHDIVFLSHFPLLPNGKIDRSLLMPSPSKRSHSNAAIPETRLEKKIQQIWRKILKEKNIGNNDNFFHIGGHSLKAIQCVDSLHKAFNISLTLQQFSAQPTISQLASFLEQVYNIKV